MTKSIQLQKQAACLSIHSNNLDEYIIDKYHNLTFLIGTKSNRPVLAVWRGRQAKPFSNYYYGSDESRQKEINRLKSSEDEIVKFKAQKKQKPDFEVGDVFVSCWGYDQTNVNAFQVIEKPSPHFAILKEINTEAVSGSEGHDCCDVLPCIDSFKNDSQSIRKKVSNNSVTINNVYWASKWDGKRSFYCSWYH